MQSLTLTSCMAPNADSFCATLAHYLSAQMQLPTTFVCDLTWQERERMFDAGQIHICWICGLPYVWKADQGHPLLELLVALVMQGARYQNRPVYFSDVLVRRTSRLYTFADLRDERRTTNHGGEHVRRSSV